MAARTAGSPRPMPTPSEIRFAAAPSAAVPTADVTSGAELHDVCDEVGVSVAAIELVDVGATVCIALEESGVACELDRLDTLCVDATAGAVVLAIVDANVEAPGPANALYVVDTADAVPPNWNPGGPHAS